ncbi:hypothetical protein ACIP5Y_10705 [Nocardia sp. NPDC088792]|uniref:hypothetical protein n=1 Tax=Nocardia sp. NPDC088792 TaxID=3364332 RepID=UPI003809B16A
MSNLALKPGTAGHPHTRQLPDGRYEARLLCRNNLGQYRKPRRTGTTEAEAVRRARKAATTWIASKPGSHTVKPSTRLSPSPTSGWPKRYCGATSPAAP